MRLITFGYLDDGEQLTVLGQISKTEAEFVHIDGWRLVDGRAATEHMGSWVVAKSLISSDVGATVHADTP
jgi:predicted SnoaL-like aldol condensation-catalyzing enzyme